MTDRELLELAAKAAGYEPFSYHLASHGRGQLSTAWTGDWLEVKKPEAPIGNCRWNPLADDGDALRLAVTLRLHFGACDYSAIASQPDGVFVQIPYGKDPGADTRRAIVSAAAVIGKGVSHG